MQVAKIETAGNRRVRKRRNWCARDKDVGKDTDRVFRGRVRASDAGRSVDAGRWYSGLTLMPYGDKDPEFVPTAAAEEHARGGKVHGRSETFE